ncbi:MAG: DNA internalization-related competence protein ComEC/Rec2 [Gammaproteobacteria bacterium]
MKIGALAFLLGIVWVQQWSRLPNGTEWFLILASLLTLSVLRYRFGCFLLIGVIWAAAYGEWRLSDRLTDDWQGKDVVVQGYVATLPRLQDNRVGFDFIVTQAPRGIPTKLLLNWYTPKTVVKAGQSWEILVRLKQPHGRFNPGGFDYEAWMFARHIGASGYVRSEPPPKLIELPFAIGRSLALWRQTIADSVEKAFPGSGQGGIIQALSIGNTSAISRRLWNLFRTTGTVHLMVISGTHISLVAGMVFLLVKRCWVWLGGLRVSPQVVAALIAWLSALLYVGLAGFTIPTQRALIMLTIALLAVVWQRNTEPFYILQFALLAVVMFDPLAVLSPGFWLSFVAVGLLLYISAGRIGRLIFWREAGKLHVSMAIGLAPLLLAFFQQASLVAPLANAVAVPVIGMLITPMALLAALISVFSPGAAAIFLWSVDKILQSLVWFLEQLANWPLATLIGPQPSWYAMVFAILAVLLLLAPKGMPGRYLIPFLLLPTMFSQMDKPRAGEIRLTLLDVGQGLAAVIQTASHVLVYDTGPKYSEQSDSGETVLLPFLRYRGMSLVDGLIISHGENDHSGGAASLIAGIAVDRIYSSAAEWAERDNGNYCRSGLQWQWDGVIFEILSPGRVAFDSENNNSCVLKVIGDKQSVLLPGDIEHNAERRLVARYGSGLSSSILISAHHGSNTSSRGYFLDAVSPQLILISSGYRNRFGFPRPSVIRRYRERHISYLNTAEQGAVDIKLSGESVQTETMRQRYRRYWMDK